MEENGFPEFSANLKITVYKKTETGFNKKTVDIVFHEIAVCPDDAVLFGVASAYALAITRWILERIPAGYYFNIPRETFAELGITNAKFFLALRDFVKSFPAEICGLKIEKLDNKTCIRSIAG